MGSLHRTFAPDPPGSRPPAAAVLPLAGGPRRPRGQRDVGDGTSGGPRGCQGLECRGHTCSVSLHPPSRDVPSPQSASPSASPCPASGHRMFPLNWSLLFSEQAVIYFLSKRNKPRESRAPTPPPPHLFFLSSPLLPCLNPRCLDPPAESGDGPQSPPPRDHQQPPQSPSPRRSTSACTLRARLGRPLPPTSCPS